MKDFKETTEEIIDILLEISPEKYEEAKKMIEEGEFSPKVRILLKEMIALVDEHRPESENRKEAAACIQ